MRTFCKKTAQLAGFVVALAWVPSCRDACRELSNAICNCQVTDAARRNCIATVAQRQGQRVKGSDESEVQNRCAALVESCTCSALHAGELDRCGLSDEQAPP